MDKVNLQQYIIDIKGILVYMSDIETNELYYLNPTGEKFFGLEKKDWEHKKYYEILHILRSADSPKNTELVENETHVWQSYIPYLDKYFRIHVTLKEVNGKKMRLGIAQDITESVIFTLNMEEKLREQNTLNSYLELLLNPIDMTSAINVLLEMLCDYYTADRVHIEHVPTKDCHLKEIFEFTKIKNIHATKIFNNLIQGNIVDWFTKYSEHGIACVSTSKDLDTISEFHTHRESHNFIVIPLYQDQSVNTSLLFTPLDNNKKIILAFIIIENPTTHSENKQLISSISKLYENFYLKNQIKQRVLNLAHLDGMTELFNRNCFEEKYKELSTQYYNNLGIIYIDINGLKHKNDTEGHKAGDELIHQCAQILKSVFKGNTYRTGGDEFVVLIENTLEADFQELVINLEKRIAENTHVSLSVGYFWNDGSMLIADHLQQADAMMYQRKKEHYNSLNNRRLH